MAKMKNLACDIIAYESGELDEEGTISLFQTLVDTGMVNQLQGCYGHTAQRMLDAGLIGPPIYCIRWTDHINGTNRLAAKRFTSQTAAINASRDAANRKVALSPSVISEVFLRPNGYAVRQGPYLCHSYVVERQER